MGNPMKEFSRDVYVINELGLHARSAAKIAELAQTAKANVWIIKDGKEADASSIIDILSLACAKGSKITLKIDDQVDAGILKAVVDLVEKGFGE